MKTHTHFDLEGRYLGHTITQDQHQPEPIAQDGVMVDTGAVISNCYLENGVIKLQTPNTSVLSGKTISGIDLPARALIDGRFQQITDSIVTLSFDFPGTYRVEIQPVKQIPVIFMVTQP